MKIIIDRFEGEYALVELKDRRVIQMSRDLLPDKAKEGDVIDILINEKETEIRRKKMKELMDQLMHRLLNQ